MTRQSVLSTIGGSVNTTAYFRYAVKPQETVNNAQIPVWHVRQRSHEAEGWQVRRRQVNGQAEEVAMPKGTKVHRVYDALREKGMSKGKAARIAQAQTGHSLATGRPTHKGKRKRA